MKQILLAACAVLALMASADARSKGDKLPDFVLGGWCEADNKHEGISDRRRYFERSQRSECSSKNDYFIEIKPDRNNECVFDSIKEFPPEPNKTWMIKARCRVFRDGYYLLEPLDLYFEYFNDEQGPRSVIALWIRHVNYDD
jgi:hypothetical protein